MAVRLALREGGAVAGPQNPPAVIGYERRLARQDPDEFILVRMPVPLARPGAGLEGEEVDAEIESPPASPSAFLTRGAQGASKGAG